MARRYQIVFLALLGCAWSAACNTFDDELEARIPVEGGTVGTAGSAGTDGSGGTDGDGGTSGGTDGSGGASGTGGSGATGGGDGSTLIQSADFCEPAAQVPTRAADNRFLDVDTTGLRNDFANLSFCGISRSLPETDAFFKVDLIAGRRYHFHVRAQPMQDLAVYLLRSCNEQTCTGSIDECPAGTDEHFSFVATQAGTYFLGIDGISTSATTVPFTFLATQPTCGNRDAARGGVDEHSEVCDDGNTNETDDCDNKCRKVLNTSETEAEPNGDPYGANVLRLAANTIQVRGRLGGPCDTDYYAVSVPQGAALTVSLVNEQGGVCAGLPSTEIRLLNAGFVQQASVASTCPVFEATTPGTTNLAAGEYFLAVRTTASGPTFNYLLRATVVP
jgi:hypothetical protein